jgi:pyochelin synthetase
MTAVELLAELESLGVELQPAGDDLRFRAPTGTLTPERRKALARHKHELISLLRRRGLAAPSDPPRLVPATDQRHEPFALTDIQQAFWIGRRTSSDVADVPGHTLLELEIPGLDAEHLRTALRLLVARHDMLRTVVLPDGRQQLLPEVPEFETEVVDLRGAGDPVGRSRAVRERYARRSFASGRWPLMSACLVLLDGSRTRLLLAIDLVIIDAWSLQILIRELLQLHADPSLRLPPLELSFRDWVQYDQAFQRSETYRRDLDYWRGRIPQLPPAPQLPLADGTSARSTATFARHTGRLGADLWNRLKERGRNAGLTPSVVVMAAFAEAIREWSANPSFTLNLAIFNRPPLHPQIQAVVGNFTSNVLVAADRTDGTFRSRAQHLQERLAEALEHLSVSGVRVLREAARMDDRALPPVMPVVFTSLLTESAAGRPLRLHEHGEIVNGLNQPPHVWIDHQVYEDADELISHWDVVEGLFPPGLTAEMFGAFMALLRDLANGEAAWDRPGRVLLPPVHLHVRAAANATEGPLPDQLLPELFTARVPDRAAEPAVITSHEVLSYAEVERRSRAVAHWLRARGVRPGTLVGVVMNKGWEQVVAVLGVLRAGAAYLPIDPALPGRRMRFLLENGRVRLALTQPWADDRVDWPDGIQRMTIARATGNGTAQAEEPAPLTEPVQTQRDLAYVIYTSGSTGQPKGVMIPHRGAVNTIADVNDRFAVAASDRVLALSNLGFDLSVYDVFGPLGAGGALVIPDPDGLQDPAHWIDLMERERVTIWNSVPALMEMLVEYLEGHRRRPAGRLRLVLLSGDWIPLTMPDRIRKHFPDAQVISLGGATEASIWSILHPIEAADPEWRSIPYGRPMRNQRFHVLDHAMEPRPSWAPGHLYIGGEGLADGYWGDEEQTRQRFVRHPRTGERLYDTGDLGLYRPDGTIEFLGRDDFQVKINGHRIELGEIEWALTLHPAVRTAVAGTVEDASGHKRLVAHVVADGATGDADWRVFLRERLPDYMIPTHIVVVEALPLTPVGKVDRRALPVPDALRQTHTTVPPGTETERELVRMWEELLGVNDIGVSDSFFALGGDSLLATRFAARLSSELEVEFPVRTVFDEPTITALATVVDGIRAKGSRATSRPIRRLPRGTADLAATLGVLRDKRGDETAASPSRPSSADDSHG